MDNISGEFPFSTGVWAILRASGVISQNCTKSFQSIPWPQHNFLQWASSMTPKSTVSPGPRKAKISVAVRAVISYHIGSHSIHSVMTHERLLSVVMQPETAEGAVNHTHEHHSQACKSNQERHQTSGDRRPLFMANWTTVIVNGVFVLAPDLPLILSMQMNELILVRQVTGEQFSKAAFCLSWNHNDELSLGNTWQWLHPVQQDVVLPARSSGLSLNFCFHYMFT